MLVISGRPMAASAPRSMVVPVGLVYHCLRSGREDLVDGMQERRFRDESPGPAADAAAETVDPDAGTRHPPGAGGAGSAPACAKLGPYEITREIGRGGMGVVYEGFHPGLKRRVALKVLIAGEDASEEAIARFLREAEAVARLGHHPGIVPVYDIGKEGRRHFFAMHLVDGTSLDKVIDRGCMAPRDAASVALSIARALEHAHSRGVLHRDVKPANILLAGPASPDAASQRSGTSDAKGPSTHVGAMPYAGPHGPQGGGKPDSGSGKGAIDWSPMLTDFGLAKDAGGSSGVTRSGTSVGTPNYMPPEQALGDIAKIDARSDVYALGATLYEMLTASPPFEGDAVVKVLHSIVHFDPAPVRRRSPWVDRDLETICLKCLEKDPRRRYQSALELADELERFLGGRAILARRPAFHERLMRWASRQKSAIAAAAAAFLLSGAAGAAVWSAAGAGSESANLPPVPASTAVSPENERAAARAAEAASREVELARNAYRVSAAPGVRRRHMLKALDSCLEACRLDPRRAESFAMLGEIQTQLSRTGLAIEAYSSAIAANPDLSDAYFGRIRIRKVKYHLLRALTGNHLSGDLRKSIESDLGQIRRIGNKPEMTDTARAFILFFDGENVRAMEAAEAAIKANPTFPELLALKASIRVAMLQAGQRAPKPQEFEPAVGEFRTALQLSGGDLQYRGSYIDALLSLGRREEALREADCMAAEIPDRPYAYYIRAHIRRSAGDEAGARADLETAEGLEFENADEHLFIAGLVLLSVIKGRWMITPREIEEASRHIDAALVLENERVEVRGMRGLAAMFAGRSAEAVPDIEECLKAYPDSPVAPFCRMALDRLRAGMDLSVDSAVFLYYKALEMFKAGEALLAEQVMLKALEKIDEGRLLEAPDRNNRAVYRIIAGTGHYSLARWMALRSPAAPGRARDGDLLRRALEHLGKAIDHKNQNAMLFERDPELRPVFDDASLKAVFDEWKAGRGAK